ncbi:hypothetical protein MASR2M15_20430 [Anaerolineales bacterium]
MTVISQQDTAQANKFYLRYETILLVLILALAFVLRIQYIGQIEHNIDHSYPIWQAMTTLYQGQFPIIGQQTWILAHPALTAYIFAPILALTDSLYAIYAFIIVLNTIGVYLTFLVAKQMLSSPVALIAIALMAVNPWLIEYSRYSWPPAFLPFLLPLSAYLLFPVLMQKSSRPSIRLVLAFLVFSVMALMTLNVYFVFASLALLIIIFFRRLPLKALALGLLIFAATLAIFALAIFSDWENLRPQPADMTHEGQQAFFRGEAIEHAFRFVSGDDYDLARGLQAPIHDTELRQSLSVIGSGLVSISLVIGIVLAIATTFRPGACLYPPDVDQKSARDSGIILLIWFWLPTLAMAYNASLVHPYYFMNTVPAGYILAGWGITYLFNPYRRINALLILIALSLFGLLMGINSSRYYQETQAIPGAHGLGALPLEIGQQMGDVIKANLKPDMLVFADNSEWNMNSFARSLFPVIRNNQSPALTVIPASGALYILAQEPDQNIQIPYATRLWDQPLADGIHISIDQFSPETVPTLLASLDSAQNIPGEKWIDLLDYEIQTKPDSLTVTSYWQVKETPLHHYFAPFIHVFNQQGERIAIVDSEAHLAGDLWQVGDIHIYEMQIPLKGLKAEQLDLVIGQFDSTSNENVIFILKDGTYSALIPLE